MSFLKAVFRFLVGVLFLPLAIPVSRAFYIQLSGLSALGSKNKIYFLWGIGLYVIMHIFLYKPNYLYNLGRETAHMLLTWLSFGRAKNLKVSSFFINISPYFIPIYTLILCLAYFVISKLRDITPYVPYFVFFIGFTLAMHILMTVEALKVAQPDLIRTGYLFSLSLIYVINIIVAAFVISLIFSGFYFSKFFLQFCLETRELYISIFRQLFRVS